MTHPADFFLHVTEPLLAESTVTRGTMMGFPCLRTDGAFFASCDNQSGHLVVKLPAPHVDMLVETGYGKRFRPNGRTFREWVLIEDRNQERWDGLLREAFAFVRGRELSAG